MRTNKPNFNASLNVVISDLFEELSGTLQRYKYYRIGRDNQYVTSQNQTPKRFQMDAATS